MKLKFKIHSIVDVITNSSTVIFTYQNSSSQAKSLVQEMLKLSGSDKNADDIFYYGVFCENDIYLENKNLPEDCPKVDWNSTDRKLQQEAQDKWLEDLKLSIMKGDISQPEWMTKAEAGNSDWNDLSPSTNLELIPKDAKYEEFGNRISALLSSVSADGGRDG